MPIDGWLLNGVNRQGYLLTLPPFGVGILVMERTRHHLQFLLRRC